VHATIAWAVKSSQENERSDSYSTTGLSARITPIRASIVGLPCSATSINACMAVCHSDASCSAAFPSSSVCSHQVWSRLPRARLRVPV
jgi:hypothetical protein